MHSHFPHPIDRVIILRVHNEPDSADIETVRSLLENRVKECGSIWVLLDADCSEQAFAHWIASSFQEFGTESIERLAIVGKKIKLPTGTWKMSASPEAVRQFTPAQREQALLWIQTGGDA
ncbi:MAG: STAS/SEC14 domain-containing protein [Chthoniobacterales bacterium]|nr:STAS/SEC14 domain-containing protein [Chthoniobacterales bacterium]